ncbi:MAG: zinc ribbon domain-containing protein [Promethearchaeota archaeon]
MASKTDQTSPEIYQKLVALSELIIERNNIIRILSGIKRAKTTLSEKQIDIILHKFLSKIALIDKRLNSVATGLSCSICQEQLTIADEILACERCGSPAHKNHLLKHVKAEGYCLACGEYLKYQIKGTIKTITHDLFKSCVYTLSDKVHKLEIFYSTKLIERPPITLRTKCPKCNRQISPDWKFCRYCGNKLKQPKKHELQVASCPRCGRQIKISWKFCKMCGFSLANNK